MGGTGQRSVRDLRTENHRGPAGQPCLLLFFEGDARPTAAQLADAVRMSGIGDAAHDPLRRAQSAAVVDWLELVIDGLTFDVLGLMPGRAFSIPPPRHRLGIATERLLEVETIAIAPGPHVAAAANAMPVVRTMLRIAAVLARKFESVVAAHWLPAASLVGRDVFLDIVDGWVAGGVFPAPILTGIVERPDGALRSDGFAFFSGQELELEPALCGDRIAATRLLMRLLDQLAGHRAFAGEQEVALAGGGCVRIVGQGALVRVLPG